MRIIFTLLSAFILMLPIAAQKESSTAQKMQAAGYINIQELDKTLKVSLMYTRADNFTGTILYDDLREAYLHPIAAQALCKKLGVKY